MNLVLQFFAACHSIVEPLIEVHILTEARLITALSLVMCIDIVTCGLICVFTTGDLLWGEQMAKDYNAPSKFQGISEIVDIKIVTNSELLAKAWYDQHIKTTTEFETWWIGFYGTSDQYNDPEEYWVRKAFAWHGWNARNENN